jgi:hypothetical protein
MSILKWSGRALCVALLAGSLAGCDFIEPVIENPNQVPTAQVSQLLVGASVTHMFMQEANTSRLAAMWTQQMAGNQRQTAGFDVYQVFESDDDDWMNLTYDNGGLVSLREGQRLSVELEYDLYLGIFKVYEAMMIGMLASFSGDIPYTQAVSGEPEPVLDDQAAVYAAIQTVLDEAITAFAASGDDGLTPGSDDFVYGGDAAMWTAAAQTLKARFYMHWGETDATAFTSALAVLGASNGIRSATGDWLNLHTTSAFEASIWFQFQNDRSGYIVGGEFGLDMLQNQGDDRLPYYYSEAKNAYAGTYIGSPPGNPGGDPADDASELACHPSTMGGCLGVGFGQSEFDFPVLTCAETYYIIAEAEVVGGNDGAAVTALDAALDCDEARWTLYGGTVDLDNIRAQNDLLTGTALLEEIKNQKYVSLFLNPEIYNDYRRNPTGGVYGGVCYPAITPYNYPTDHVPSRFFYSQQERQTNSNIPDADAQQANNDNDPANCP